MEEQRETMTETRRDPADGRSARKNGEGANGKKKERRREWASKCDGERTREKDGVTLYEAGETYLSQDRKSAVGILGGFTVRDNAILKCLQLARRILRQSALLFFL